MNAEKDTQSGNDEVLGAMARKYKAIAGMGILGLGLAQGPIWGIEWWSIVGGGVLAFLGGLYVLEQIRAPTEETA